MSTQSETISQDLPRYGIWPFVLPFAVFMVFSMIEPHFPTQQDDVLTTESTREIEEQGASAAAEYVLNERRELANRFFVIYGLKVLVSTGLLIFFWKTYLSQFPLTATIWSVPVGVLGVIVWVALSATGIETLIMNWFGSEQTRSQFNPFSQLPEQWQLTGFLAIRFFGLVVMVPILEELFLRGFLMRFVESPNWWNVNIGRLAFRTMLIAPLYGLLTHPAEALAAIAWFSLVTWLVNKTGKFWDAVIAHAVTNLLLGIYLCIYGQWQLW